MGFRKFPAFIFLHIFSETPFSGASYFLLNLLDSSTKLLISQSLLSFLKKKKIYIYIYLFIYGCVESLFLCEGFLQLRQAGATVHHGAQASHYCGLSCCGAQAPDTQAQ